MHIHKLVRSSIFSDNETDELTSIQIDVLGGHARIGALIILNGNPLEKILLEIVWPNQSNPIPCICADGAANLLFELPTSQEKHVPSHIVGDLDSATQSVLAHYAKHGTKIVEMKSQNSNDFHKALKVAQQSNTLIADLNLPILIIGGMHGRMDQTLSNMNELYKCAQRGTTAYWLSTTNVVMVLTPGSHTIQLGDDGVGTKCGLIPIGGRVQSVTTSGLRWDMQKQALTFGMFNLVSSSNEAARDTVTIETSDPVLWTMEPRRIPTREQ